jgi:hypothetical protein
MSKFPKANAIAKQVTETLTSIYQKRNGQRFTITVDASKRVVRKQMVTKAGGIPKATYLAIRVSIQPTCVKTSW